MILGVEGDKVVLVLSHRTKQICLDCDEALKMAEGLESLSHIAEKNIPGVYTHIPWGVNVKSYDGKVWLVLDPPMIGSPDKVPFPAKIARQLADMIRTKESFARHGLEIVVVK